MIEMLVHYAASSHVVIKKWTEAILIVKFVLKFYTEKGVVLIITSNYTIYFLMIIKRAAIFSGEKYRRKDQIDYSDAPICSFYRCGYRNKRKGCQDITNEVCYYCEVLNFFVLKHIRKYY